MPRAMLPAVLLTAAATIAMAAAPKAPMAKASPTPTATPAAAPAAAPTPAVVVKTTEAIHALVVPMKGSYMQHMDAFARLFEQLGAQGKEPIGAPFGRYFNRMPEVPEVDLLWEIGVPVATDVKATAPLELKDIPAGLNASLTYQGPMEGMAAAISSLTGWVEANGYRSTGALMMLFTGEPGDTEVQIEMRVPVEKKQ